MKLRLLGIVPSKSEALERALHHAFAANRLRAEWFEGTAELHAEIERMLDGSSSFLNTTGESNRPWFMEPGHEHADEWVIYRLSEHGRRSLYATFIGQGAEARAREYVARKLNER